MLPQRDQLRCIRFLVTSPGGLCHAGDHARGVVRRGACREATKLVALRQHLKEQPVQSRRATPI